MADWATLKAVCSQCTRCGLCETRHNVVFGIGNENADILFSLSEYEFISVPFGGSTVIEAENVSALREDFTKPFN